MAQDKTPVKLGAIEILTGPNSRYGIAIQRGFDLAPISLRAAFSACSLEPAESS
jgi:branched-chain amino acid transport system substrate-binding protein